MIVNISSSRSGQQTTMPSTANLEQAEVADYSYLMADGRSREFIWGEELRK